MSNTGDGCALLVAGSLLGLMLSAWVLGPFIKDDAREWGLKRGRQMQFCIDHGGQWDDANVRCLKNAETITVQVKP